MAFLRVNKQFIAVILLTIFIQACAYRPMTTSISTSLDTHKKVVWLIVNDDLTYILTDIRILEDRIECKCDPFTNTEQLILSIFVTGLAGDPSNSTRKDYLNIYVKPSYSGFQNKSKITIPFSEIDFVEYYVIDKDGSKKNIIIGSILTIALFYLLIYALNESGSGFDINFESDS